MQNEEHDEKKRRRKCKQGIRLQRSQKENRVDGKIAGCHRYKGFLINLNLKRRSKGGRQKRLESYPCFVQLIRIYLEWRVNKSLSLIKIDIIILKTLLKTKLSLEKSS